MDSVPITSVDEATGPRNRLQQQLGCIPVFVTVAVWSIVFAVAHTQAPLYYSNQYQYFLHGLAQGGLGELGHDWLANTQDPTPVFSAGVAWTYRHLGEWPFQFTYIVLLGIYFVSLVSLCSALPGTPLSGAGWFALLTALVAVHAAIFRLVSVQLTGTDYPWYLQSGVAGQYILGPGLQPSAFGVLLVASIAAFVHGRIVLAVACAVIACVVHATYLLPAAWLTLACMHVLWHGGRRRAALALGIGTLLAVIPITIYSVTAFVPTSTEQFAEAQRILAEVRIPHHALVARWCDGIAMGQIGWVVLALILVRRTQLFPLLAIPALMSVILTLAQVVTGNPTLALLFPWRTSAILAPIATPIILARLAYLAATFLDARLIATVGVVVLITVTVGGIVVMARGLSYKTNQAELPALEFIRADRRPGDVYLIPVSIPPVGTGARGSVSTSFTPPPRPKPGSNLIPVDFQRFRLFTGAALYVDFKSIPYKDVDVLEWYQRMRQVERWYGERTWGPKIGAELRSAGITHVVATADRDLAGETLERVYGDDAYVVYRVRLSD